MKVWAVWVTGGEAENLVIGIHRSEAGAQASADRENQQYKERYNVRHDRYAVEDYDLED